MAPDVDATDEEETGGVAIVDAADEGDTVTAADPELGPDKDADLKVTEEVDVAETEEGEGPDEEIGVIEPAIDVGIGVCEEEDVTVIETY